MWEIAGMILNKKIYFIIGSISTGKSAVVNILKQKGYYTIEADDIVYCLYENKEVQKKLVKHFGIEIIKNEKVDRKTLGDIIFNDEIKKELLENITHPLVMNEIFKKINNSTENIVFIELPLYYKVEKIIQENIPKYKIILIRVNRETQIKRLMMRNKISREKALNLLYNIRGIE
ncbi:dephospho-CoA kinase, partial [Peptostreptococcaceae bacterium OttesenSCG-928-C18]|nr:dephospho-CoA kinase [Peptostreptococcaceae bacterium OttesenSCG-928-C18]